MRTWTLLICFLCCFYVSFAAAAEKSSKTEIHTAYSEKLKRQTQELVANEYSVSRFSRQYKWKLDELTFKYATELGISDSFLRKVEELPPNKNGILASYRPLPHYVVDFGPYLIPIIGEDLYYKIKKRDRQITEDDIKSYMEGIRKLYDFMYEMSLK